MLPIKKYRLFLVVLTALTGNLMAQQPQGETTPYTDVYSDTKPGNAAPDASAVFTVREIIITGNRRTRESIILREVPFRPGQKFPLQDLVKKFEDARRQLLNTTLFFDVVVAMSRTEGYFIDISVEVKERWYVFPVPYFKPVDRNLNQWLFEKGASLNRVNYGLKILHNNASGRNDKLKVFLISGYTKQVSFNYDRLYFDKKMRWGIATAFAIGKNREINYITVKDKQVFLKHDEYLRSFLTANADITYRRAIRTRHRLGIGYTIEDVKDTIVKLNPDYFQDGRNRIQFPEIYYRMTYYDLDYIPYPTRGYAAEVTMGKKGLGKTINVWHLSAKASGSWHTGKRSFVNLVAFGNIKAPFKQPYFMQRFLGYGDAFMQGYEYYVVDGVAGGFMKATYTRRLFSFGLRSPGRISQLPERIPFRIYAKIYGNAGYVHNPQPGANFLSNKMLYSAGMGIDIFTAYDFTLKLEWTFNQLGQNGLFLHRKSIF